MTHLYILDNGYGEKVRLWAKEGNLPHYMHMAQYEFNADNWAEAEALAQDARIANDASDGDAEIVNRVFAIQEYNVRGNSHMPIFLAIGVTESDAEKEFAYNNIDIYDVLDDFGRPLGRYSQIRIADQDDMEYGEFV